MPLSNDTSPTDWTAISRSIEAAMRPDATAGELAIAWLRCGLLAATFHSRIDQRRERNAEET